MNSMTASDNCYSLIRRFEDLRLLAYQCPARIWTIGYGHTDGVREGMRIDKDRADELLRADVASVEAGLDRLLAGINAPPLAQSQYDALVSLCFNLRGGAYALPHAAPKLTAALAKGDWAAAAHEFLDMDHANGKPLPGLTQRRKLESALFSGSAHN